MIVPVLGIDMIGILCNKDLKLSVGGSHSRFSI